jgi:multiple sugar transport system substrate-binding protein
MRRSTLTIGTLGVSVALLVAGCSSGSKGGGGSAGDDWTIPDKDPTATIQVLGILDPVKEHMQQVLDAFAKDHPTIKVEYEYTPFDSLNSVLDAHMANKDGNPDVFWADQPRTAALAVRGYSADITEQFTPYFDVWDSAPKESSMYDGKLYGVPIANSTQLLFYNKDLLDKAGVAYPSTDTGDGRETWEQLLPDVQKVVDAGAKNGFVFGQLDRYYQLEALSSSLGGSPGATGDDNLTPDITSEPWVEAMQWYGKLAADGLMPRGITADETDAAFLAGDTAYEITGPWLLGNLAAQSDVNWGVAAHPYFEGGKPVTGMGSWSLALSPFSDEKEAAAIFMKWMAVDGGGQYAIIRPDPELPATPEGKKVYFERDMFQSEEGQNAAKIIDYETSNTGVPRLGTVGYVEFEDILGQMYSDVRNGADAETALKTASDKLTTAWAQYK